MNLPKILIVSTTFPRWNNDKIPKFVYEFCKSLLTKYEIHVLAPHVKGAKRNEIMDGIYIHRFQYCPPSWQFFGNGQGIYPILKSSPWKIIIIPFFIIGAIYWFIKLNLSIRFEIVHIHWIIPFAPVFGFLKLFFNYRLVITSHGSDVFPFIDGNKLLVLFVKIIHNLFTFPFVDQMVAVSMSLKSALEEMYIGSPNNIAIASMGIYTQIFNNKNRKVENGNRTSILFVGRLVEFKGVRYLVEAIRNIYLSHNVKLDIVGDGFERENLEAQVKKNKLEDKVKFHGFLTQLEVVSFLRDSDIFVGPSIITNNGEKEGLGLVFLEAMASDLVVVGTDSGGIPDVIQHEVNGLLVETRNSLQISEAISRLIEDPLLRKKLVENGFLTAKEYDWEEVSKKYSKIYENVLSG